MRAPTAPLQATQQREARWPGSAPAPRLAALRGPRSGWVQACRRPQSPPQGDAPKRSRVLPGEPAAWARRRPGSRRQTDAACGESLRRCRQTDAPPPARPGRSPLSASTHAPACATGLTGRQSRPWPSCRPGSAPAQSALRRWGGATPSPIRPVRWSGAAKARRPHSSRC